MKDPSFTHLISQTFAKQGWRSLKEFYQQHRFSFSYEYLRQIMNGVKIPQPELIKELAHALQLDEGRLKSLANDSLIGKKITHYYRPSSQSNLGKFSEKVEQYKNKKKEHLKLIQTYEDLGVKEKKQVWEYLKFLRQQCRKQKKSSH